VKRSNKTQSHIHPNKTKFTEVARNNETKQKVYHPEAHVRVLASCSQVGTVMVELEYPNGVVVILHEVNAKKMDM
jgi:hypothetical protein